MSLPPGMTSRVAGARWPVPHGNSSTRLALSLPRQCPPATPMRPACARPWRNSLRSPGCGTTRWQRTGKATADERGIVGRCGRRRAGSARARGRDDRQGRGGSPRSATHQRCGRDAPRLCGRPVHRRGCRPERRGRDGCRGHPHPRRLRPFRAAPVALSAHGTPATIRNLDAARLHVAGRLQRDGTPSRRLPRGGCRRSMVPRPRHPGHSMAAGDRAQ